MATASSTLVRVAEVDAHEGPVYAGSSLFFTTPRPGVAIKRLRLDGLDAVAVETVRADANAANGMALAPGGRLLVCEQGSHVEPARISAVDPATGEAETVVDRFGGLPLNSPNDIVVKRDGSIWFTDPSYGHLQGFRPEPALPDAVYRFDPQSGRLEAVAAGFDKPNGLAFSPDESVLYVGDSGEWHELRAFDVAGAELRNDRLFAVIEPGYPDGIKVDAAGRVYSSCADGVQVFDPDGDLVDEIDLPGAVNFCFGGAEHDVLFITTDTAVWAAVLHTKGA